MRGSFSAHFINLAALRHPISADLFIEKTVPGTKAILLRLLGGLDYWRYGAEELAHACRKHGVTLAVLSGDGRADPRLPPLSTVEAAELDALDRLLGAGGPQNAGLAISALMARDGGLSSSPVEALPEFGIYRETGPCCRRLGCDRLLSLLPAGGRCAPGRCSVRYTSVPPLTLALSPWERGR